MVSHSSIRLQGSSSKWGENGLLIKHEVFLHFPHPDCLLRRIVPSLNVTRSTHPLALRYPSWQWHLLLVTLSWMWGTVVIILGSLLSVSPATRLQVLRRQGPLWLLVLWSQCLDQSLPQTRCRINSSWVKERRGPSPCFLAPWFYIVRASQLEKLWATTGHHTGTGGLVIPKGLKYTLDLSDRGKIPICGYDLRWNNHKMPSWVHALIKNQLIKSETFPLSSK